VGDEIKPVAIMVPPADTLPVVATIFPADEVILPVAPIVVPAEIEVPALTEPRVAEIFPVLERISSSDMISPPLEVISFQQSSLFLLRIRLHHY